MNANGVFKTKIARAELIYNVVAQYSKEVLATEEAIDLGTSSNPKSLACTVLTGKAFEVKGLVDSNANLFTD